VRHYNNAFAFTSICAKIDEELAKALRGGFTFRAHGALYHRVSTLHPPPGVAPSFAQLYVFDTEDEQFQRRRAAFTGLCDEVLREVQTVLHALHPHVLAFKSNAERIRNDPSVSLRLQLVERQCNDPRRYNLPSAHEIAALIPIDDVSESGRRCIVLENREGSDLHFIDEADSMHLSLRYPLIYPRGELGWSYNIPLRDRPYVPNARARGGATVQESAPRADEEEPGYASAGEDGPRGRGGSTRVTQQEWWKHHIHFRTPLQPTLRAGRLFHELLVDAFAAIESARLRWVRHNQVSLRSGIYQGMQDALAQNEDVTGASVGQNIYLPPSHIGSPRQMREAYLDAMALVRHFGPPDFFITFTANPAWEEIQRELAPGQSHNDRPDLVARVFQLKLTQLRQEILKKHVLGGACVLCFTIEFQKRGLPHAHMLAILDRESRIKSADDIDAAIRADLPDAVEEPLLWDVVVRNMLHAKCGPENPGASCMRNQKCRFRFPFPFCDETFLDEGKSVVYRRPDNGRYAERQDGDGFPLHKPARGFV